MPARNSAPMDTVRMPPQTIIRIDGGMITASTAETAVIATEKREVVALLRLRLDEDLGLAGGIRRGRAGDAGKEDRQHHVDLRQAAREMPHHRARQLHQPVGGAAHVHQVGGQQEERHRQQDERVVGVEGLLHQRHGVEPRLDHQDRQAGEPERERHRHAQEHQQEEQPEQDERRLPGDSTAPVMRLSRAMMRRSSTKLLAEEDDPGHAGHRPGDVDQPQRQLGELGDAVPGELRELRCRPTRRPAPPPARRGGRAAARGLAARRQARPHVDSKWVDSRTPIMAPIMIVQMNRKRAISSVQM